MRCVWDQLQQGRFATRSECWLHMDELVVYGASPPSPSTYTSKSPSHSPLLASHPTLHVSSSDHPSDWSPAAATLQSHPTLCTAMQRPARSTKPPHSTNATTPRTSSPSKCTISGACGASVLPTDGGGVLLLLRQRRQAITHSGEKMMLAVVVTQLSEESVSLGGMGWGRREAAGGAWLVHLSEREGTRAPARG
ncbi:hypothetical protein C8R45DRAFT_361321 [Mycena sanguinolenta]|nr:hypothetical protein C8R45DRAFT_361321 [Mycena sanguinolenta]